MINHYDKSTWILPISVKRALATHRILCQEGSDPLLCVLRTVLQPPCCIAPLHGTEADGSIYVVLGAETVGTQITLGCGAAATVVTVVPWTLPFA